VNNVGVSYRIGCESGSDPVRKLLALPEIVNGHSDRRAWLLRGTSTASPARTRLERGNAGGKVRQTEGSAG
jgi:hypothetical protein